MSKNRFASVIIYMRQNNELISKIEEICEKYKKNIINSVRNHIRENEDRLILTLVVYANTDEIGALTGKLGSLQGIKLKTAVLSDN